MAQARFNQVGVDIEAPRPGDSGTGCARPDGRSSSTGTCACTPRVATTAPTRTASAAARAHRRAAPALLEVLPEQHFTQPPPRFTEASLVKTLEELGIGRPSTYASIISTIQDRGYVRLEDRRFYPDDVGEVVTDKLIEHFPEIINVNFTAEMEDELDEIAEGRSAGRQVLHEFYAPFADALERAEEKFERYVEELDEAARAAEEGREPGRLQKRRGGTASSSGAPAETTRRAGTSATSTARASGARDARRELPRVRQPLQRSSVASGRSWAARGTRTAGTSRRTRRSRRGSRVPSAGRARSSRSGPGSA